MYTNVFVIITIIYLWNVFLGRFISFVNMSVVTPLPSILVFSIFMDYAKYFFSFEQVYWLLLIVLMIKTIPIYFCYMDTERIWCWKSPAMHSVAALQKH